MRGPLQVIVVGFNPGADFEGRVLAEVDRLQGRGVLRLIDMLFVAKDEDRTIQRLVIGDDEDFGVLLASIIPLDGSNQAKTAVGDGLSGFEAADAWALTESLSPGTALAFLLIEHGWAQPLFDVIAETGGALLGEGSLTPETGFLVGAEVAAMEEAATEIAAAQAAETNAFLLAVAAQTHADESIAASEAIGGAAAARAIQALISAGLVEEAAAYEAVDALIADVLIVAAADEAAAEAVAEGAATISSIDHHGSGTGPALPTYPVALRGHRRETRHLPGSREGTSSARLQEAPGPQPRRGSHPGPRARPHQLTDTPTRRRDFPFAPTDRLSPSQERYPARRVGTSEYTRGEIDREKFLQRKKDITGR